MKIEKIETEVVQVTEQEYTEFINILNFLKKIEKEATTNELQRISYAALEILDKLFLKL